MALPIEKIERVAARFLSRNPAIDATSPQWQAQHDMMTRLATGGRLGVAIGVAGAGKSTALAPLVDAWKAEQRQVYGMSPAWRQAGDLNAAGITERAAVAAFMKRVEAGKYALNRNSVVVIDEVSLLGTRQMLDLLRLQETSGAQIVMIGNHRQIESVEGGPGLELLREALGSEATPELVTSIRQKTEREIAGLFRAGRAAEALAMKQQDGTAELVAGGREATLARVASLWRARIEANSDNPEFKLMVSAPTNADTREIGAAIRAEQRQIGQLGRDLTTVDAVNPQGERYELPLAIGDQVRLFDRVRDAADRRKVLANNGEVVEIRKITGSGMTVRNTAGTEGEIPWRVLQESSDGPVRLSYGYAMSVDTAQGSTATEHIHVLLAGSPATHGLKAYVAASRHQTTNWIIVDEASERRQLARHAMIDQRHDIGEPDVWRQIGENLSRQPIKASAIDMLKRSARQGPRLEL
jgi:ATP-dependent exoDNAse (exonuclease V) alpha subunit